MKTTLASVPAALQYVSAPVTALAQWAERLGPRQKQRVGLAWSGRAEHKNDHNRSLAFAQLELALQGDFEFHCLQKEVRATDVPALSQRADIRQWSAQLDSFSDTAALIAHLDLVIAVDTSVAHLAAALGKPVWLLLPFSPDWRWLVGRDDTPWYPSMQLYRQSATGDWQGVLLRVAKALKALAG
jgi:ADP-heptose:LPS heptosyltransferase